MADKDIIKTLCNDRFNDLFSDKINDEQKEIVINVFFDIIVMIYDKFNINTITADNYILSKNDYYEVLMLLFPFINDWNKLKEVDDLEDLFKSDKFNKFVINNQSFNGKDIQTLSLKEIIKIKKESITKTLSKYYHSFYPNWYTIFPIPIQDEIDNRINSKLDKLGINNLTEGDWLILLNLYQYYLHDDNVHILNKFNDFNVILNNDKEVITKEVVKRLFNDYVLKPLEIINKQIRNTNDNNKKIRDIINELDGNTKEYIDDNVHFFILLVIIYQFVSGTLSEVILEEHKKPNLNNPLILKKYDKCYHFLKGITYEQLKKNNEQIIKESIKQMKKEKKDVKKYKQELIDGDFQFGDINSLRNIYAVRWTSQLKLFINYIYSNVMFITGGTGVGKSTQIPKLISYCSVVIDNKPNGRTVCTQPRIQPTQSMIYIARQMGIIIPYGKNKSAYINNKVCDDNAQYYSSEDVNKQTNNITSPVFKMETDKSLYNQIIKRGNFLLDDRLIRVNIMVDCVKNGFDPKIISKYSTNQLIKYLKNSRINYFSKYNQYHNIIIDEVHEHNFNMDTLLCILNYYLPTNYYKLFIITATFDADEISFRKYFHFDNHNLIDNRCHFSEPFKTTTYNIKEQYEDKIDSVTELSDDEKNDKILTYINNLINYGDIIVFKAGSAEVNKCVDFLNNNMKDETMIAIPFYSQMNETLKDYVKNKSHAKKLSKKLITNDLIDIDNYSKESDAKVYNHYVLVATNIAEASITIDALTHVIDDGLQKKKVFDYDTFTDDKLELKPIGETNRLQRKGRVGRRGDGTAYFLYKKDTLINEKPIYAITIDDIRPFIFNCLDNEKEIATNLTIPVNTLIFDTKFYIQHPLIDYKDKVNKMIQILTTYNDFGLIKRSYTRTLVKTKFGIFINEILTEIEDLTLQELLCIVGAYPLRCVDSMISLICSMKLKDSVTITNIIHQFGSKKDKSDFVILINYLNTLERMTFNGKLKDYLFDKINSITITNPLEAFNQIQQQLNNIKSEFTTETITKLLNELANNDNTYLNIYSESVDVLSRNKITDKVINLATEYFKLKSSILITCLLFQKTINNKKILNNKFINGFYHIKPFNIYNYIPNLQLISPLSKYDRLTYLLTYFNYQNIFMNVTSINNTLNNSSYLNIASGLIAHNNNYSYNVVIPHNKYGTFSFSSKLNPSMQYDSLFTYIPSVMPRKRTTYINGVIDDIEILAFNFKHNINNSLIPLLPDTIKKIYRTWTDITPEQKEYIDIIKKYQ